MPTPVPLRRSLWFVLALWSCSLIAGCGGEKAVGDAKTFHPEGIPIDAESAKVPGKPKS